MMILLHHIKPKQNQVKQKKQKLYFDNHAGKTETKVNPTFLLSSGKESNQTVWQCLMAYLKIDSKGEAMQQKYEFK